MKYVHKAEMSVEMLSNQPCFVRYSASCIKIDSSWRGNVLQILILIFAFAHISHTM